jgi:AmmeMemoRadiSam system protein B
VDGKTIIADDSAFMGYPHGREHNIEVQIPILQYVAQIAKKSLKIVPIVVGRMNVKDLEVAGDYIAQKLKPFQGKKDIIIIASSDMTHHEPKDNANPKADIEWQYKKDQAVMDAFVEGNYPKTFDKASETTVCGPQTITLLMIIGKKMGYLKAKKLKYYTSYDRMGGEGPCEYSVGYFSGIIFKE